MQWFSYGYSNMTYISSLISGVGIFCFGTGLAWYHGILVLLHPQEMHSIFWVTRDQQQPAWLLKGLRHVLGLDTVEWFIDLGRRWVLGPCTGI